MPRGIRRFPGGDRFCRGRCRLVLAVWMDRARAVAGPGVRVQRSCHPSFLRALEVARA